MPLMVQLHLIYMFSSSHFSCLQIKLGQPGKSNYLVMTDKVQNLALLCPLCWKKKKSTGNQISCVSHNNQQFVMVVFTTVRFNCVSKVWGFLASPNGFNNGFGFVQFLPESSQSSANACAKMYLVRAKQEGRREGNDVGEWKATRTMLRLERGRWAQDEKISTINLDKERASSLNCQCDLMHMQIAVCSPSTSSSDLK